MNDDGRTTPADESSARRASVNKALWKRAVFGICPFHRDHRDPGSGSLAGCQGHAGGELEGVGAAAAVSVAMLIAMIVVWTLFMRFLFKLTVWTGGLFTVVVNGLIVQVAASISPNLDVDNFGWAILFGLVETVILTILLAIISYEDPVTWKRLIFRRHRRQIDPSIVGKPGVIFLEIDGLSHDAFVRAMAAGKTKTMRRWLQSGSHVLVPWETDLSSQTSASQAGLLHGNNREIPAFRWFDKELGKVVVSSNLKALGPLEEQHSNGDGLLARGGAARASMLSGDADEVMLVASRVREEKETATGPSSLLPSASPEWRCCFSGRCSSRPGPSGRRSSTRSSLTSTGISSTRSCGRS